MDDEIQLFQGSINGTSQVPIFIGTDTFSNVAGELRYEFSSGQTLLQLDSNGDGSADETLTITNGEFDLVVVDDRGFTFNLVIGSPPIEGTSGNDVLDGTPGDDIINGFAGDDIITTLAGNDTVNAGAGDDLIIGDENGTGVIDGGDGFDTLRINAEGFLGSQFDPFAETLLTFGGYSVTSIEQAEIINQNDEIEFIFQFGTSSNDIIDVSSLIFDDTSNASIFGRDGNDTLIGADADGVSNLFVGGQGEDTLVGGNGSGRNTFRGGDGTDSYQASNIGANNSIQFLSGVTQGVIADLDANTVTNDGFGNTETFTGAINNLASGNGSDVIFGNDEANDIFTNAGNDTLHGRGGNDSLNGGVGNNTFIGGQGADSLRGGTGNNICLLYTSPSPRDQRGSRMPSSA